MEFPAGFIRGERRLAALFLAAVAGAFLLESRSAFSSALRGGGPWSCWTTVSPQTLERPALYLAVYRPERRALSLVYFPGAARLSDAQKALAASAPETTGPVENFIEAQPPSWDAGDPCLAAKTWLSGAVWRGARISSNLPKFDLFLAALELGRFKEDSLRPAWLPAPALRREFFDGLLGRSGRPADASGPVTAEVFNASQFKGIASRAVKILRSKDVDVQHFGNIAQRPLRTLIYDRTGRFEKAFLVREKLGCRSAETLTQINPDRLVDVTVMLADDCGVAVK